MMSSQVTNLPSGVQTFKYVMRQSPPAPVHFTAASTTQVTTLFGLPAKYVIVGVRTQLITTFSAFGLSSVQVVLGTSGSANWYSPSFECVQAISNTSFKYWSPFTAYTMNAHDIRATFTATGALLNTMTAGEIEFTIQYRAL